VDDPRGAEWEAPWGASVEDGRLVPPKGVGAFEDIGGNDDPVPAEDEAGAFTVEPKGVGAFVDMGGKPAEPEEGVAAVGAPNGVGAFDDIRGNDDPKPTEDDAGAFAVEPKGVGAFVDV